MGVLLVPSMGGAQHPVVTTESQDNPAAYIYPQWAFDETRLVYSADAPNVCQVSIDHPNPQMIGGTGDVLPAWSPDNSHIAFNRAVTDAGHHLTIVDDNGSNPVELDHPFVLDRLPTWSPDGKWLLGYLVDGSGMVVADPSRLAQPSSCRRRVRSATRAGRGWRHWRHRPRHHHLERPGPG